MFNTDIERGLDAEEVIQSRKKNGANELIKVRRRSFISKFVSNLSDPIIKILIGALIINTALNFKNINIPETIGIACAVLTATVVSTVSEQGSEAAFEKLKESAGRGKVTVRRSGRTKEIPISELVAGDVCYIRAGMRIPADCVIAEGGVGANEAPLTGESADVKKAQGCFLYKGCLCTSGECVAVVTKVGAATEYGKIAENVSAEERKSPLKERLSELAKSVSRLGYAAAALIIFVYLFNSVVVDSGFNGAVIVQRIKDLKFVLSTVVSAVTLGVSVLVVAVPEGLPMMITVVLSSNMKKMLRSGVLVRKPVGIETAGSMNILFTDKTGTLTSGNMTVNRVYVGEKCYRDCRELAENEKDIIPLISKHLIGSSSRSPTEKALVNFCKGTQPAERTLCEEKMNFDPAVKYSACVFEGGGSVRCAVLGAAEKILSRCTSYSERGKSRKMTRQASSRFKDVIIRETSSCARVLALGLCDRSGWESIKSDENVDMTLTALISIRDELRPDIKKSVALAKQAGVQIVMITGDNKDTAGAIAKEAGILDGGKVLTGGEISEMTDKEIDGILPRLSVVARATPGDKLRLVESAHRLGLVSGMTGDGINDAPSLKSADVGFAMGSGSDVAKEAADIILTNNSFSSVTNAILYGRCVFESIRKFITYQLMMNLCALGVSLIGPFVGIDAPITVIQMLWVNIIMDTLGGLAFAGEIPLAEYMRRPPVVRNEKILNAGMTGQILYLGI
ncbi:MAG: HAD-IC family P-type ATPase, partial [Clostridia bacterium]|nr:HAD-IC family P-type ATPase [Clostridia bacterium]